MTTHTEFRSYRDEPDEPYFEDILAGDEIATPLLGRILNLTTATLVLLFGGLALLVFILWRAG